MARDRLFFRGAMEVDAAGTPVKALLVSAGVAVAFILSGTFKQVVAVLSFFFVANYAASFISLLVLRRREPAAERPFRVPLYPTLTLVALAGSLSFLVASVVADPRDSLFALLLLVASVPAFFWMRRRQRR
jgi:APA family basic amino acid/polyamine antiporter